jgi:hypothetical protein
MPKLTIRRDGNLAARTPEDTSLERPAPRPCPRCKVTLQVERSYLSKGLSGRTTMEHRFACPACDARFHYSARTGQWRELSEDGLG